MGAFENILAENDMSGLEIMDPDKIVLICSLKGHIPVLKEAQKA